MLDIIQIIQIAIILAISIGLHEYAHAYVSYRLGDPTPKLQGRLTPNPLKHIDPIGFLMIFIIHFGWGKPVQINPMYYKKPHLGELMVALAGPATNLVLAFFGILLLIISSKISGLGLQAILNPTDIYFSFWITFSFINIALAIFNLLPIPPLDGFRLVKMISWKFGEFIEKYTLYIGIFFLILILGPGSGIVGSFLTNISSAIFNVLFMILGQVFY
ncbi:MAG: site-2 protease family protein [Candidatus Absconditabacteria bacterium]|nr:site-2 protease family protein [Candidatus Absconditabacteria bacterium]